MSMFTKLKQFKDMRHQAKKLQDTLGRESVEVSEAFGKIKLTMDGNQQITKLTIDPELCSADKKEKLESTIMSAVNDATKKVQRVMATKVREMGGLDFLKQ